MNKVYAVYSFSKGGKRTVGEVTLPLRQDWMTDEEVKEEVHNMLGDKDNLQVRQIYYNRGGEWRAN